MRIAITGSRGLVGTALSQLLVANDHQVTRVVRGAAGPGDAVWDPSEGTFDTQALEGVDAFVHLAGENIGDRRWSAAQKVRIRDSRIQGTSLIATQLAAMQRPPSVLVSASAIGFYGNRGSELLDETSPRGEGFLADLTADWEAATEGAAAAIKRIVLARFGVILSPQGGALAKMLMPFKLGVGGVLGSGTQVMSWISLDDAAGALYHAITSDSLHGPVNVVAPEAVDNREFTKTLGRVLSRPTIFPMPAFAARLAFGEMADELLLSGAHVLPRRLGESGYSFQFPTLEQSLRHLLQK